MLIANIKKQNKSIFSLQPLFHFIKTGLLIYYIPHCGILYQLTNNTLLSVIHKIMNSLNTKYTNNILLNIF